MRCWARSRATVGLVDQVLIQGSPPSGTATLVEHLLRDEPGRFTVVHRGRLDPPDVIEDRLLAYAAELDLPAMILIQARLELGQES